MNPIRSSVSNAWLRTATHEADGASFRPQSAKHVASKPNTFEPERKIQLDPNSLTAAMSLSNLADLLANVGQGISRNSDRHEPAVANQRLLKTGVSMVDEIIASTKVNGQMVFANVSKEKTAKAFKYQSEPTPDIVSYVFDLLQEASSKMESMHSSTTSEANNTVANLSLLEGRARSLSSSILGLQERSPLNQTA